MSFAKLAVLSCTCALLSQSAFPQSRNFSPMPGAVTSSPPAAVTPAARVDLSNSNLPDLPQIQTQGPTQAQPQVQPQPEPEIKPVKKKPFWKKKAKEEKPRQEKLKQEKPKHADKLNVHRFSTVAVGVKASTLGAGVEIATPLSRSLNLRASAYYMQFAEAFGIDGINYSTNVNFRSGQLNVDWFPFHNGFHVSPGILYFNNGLSGSAAIDPGKPFSLSDTSYINSIDDPVSGTASITYGQHLAPTLTFGFSNVIPRSGKRFTVPFEIGVAYTQAATMDVKLAGLACTVQGCFNAATDPGTQANLRGEISDINDTIKKVPIFPIVSLGVAFRF